MKIIFLELAVGYDALLGVKPFLMSFSILLNPSSVAGGA